MNESETRAERELKAIKMNTESLFEEKSKPTGFNVATFAINLATSGSETSTKAHRLPSFSLQEGDEGQMTAIVVFIPEGLPVLTPKLDETKPEITLYYRQEAYAAVLDLLSRPGKVRCEFFAEEGGSPWGRLNGDAMKRVTYSGE